MFRYVLLGMLRDGGLRHGYGLAKEYEQRTGVKVVAGNVYRELRKLVDEGLVERAPNSEGADPRRMPHVITEAGLDTFGDWFSTIPLSSVRDGSDGELAARLTFFVEVDPEMASTVLERFRLDYWRHAKQLEQDLEKTLRLGLDESKAHPMLVHRRLRHVETELEFLDEVLEKCKSNRSVRNAVPNRVAQQRAAHG